MFLSMLTMLFATVTAHGDDYLHAHGTYFGVNRPVMVEVLQPRARDDEEAQGALKLVLLSVDGGALGEASANRGRVDIAELIPAIWNLRRTAYLQLLQDGEPRGSALVIQPMLEAMRPQIAVAQRPDGRTFNRIVGWSVEDPEPEVGRDRRYFTGLRIYPERDVVLHTSKGRLRLMMRPDEAPNTVWNFLELVRGGYYAGVVFHRIVPFDASGHPFVIQAGDPTGTGRGGPGYRIDLEPSDVAHDFGVISMARTDDPDSAGSQFFICLSRAGTGRLDGQYTAFGHAIDGADTILAIEGVELADPAAGRPADPPIVHRAEQVPAPPRTPGKSRFDERIERPQPAPPEPTGRVPR